LRGFQGETLKYLFSFKAILEEADKNSKFTELSIAPFCDSQTDLCDEVHS
jgi:hypothetical protein